MGSKTNKKAHPKSAKPPVIPSADQIKLPDAIFAQQDGQLLPTIPLHKVEAHAQGVAVCNIQDVQHFMHLTAPLSSEGLALLILDHADPRLPDKSEHTRVPAMSACTGEPMLVSAAMIQLGAKQVVRHVPSESFALEEIQTKVLKVLVYKDEWPGSWQSFLQHPVKDLFDHELLQAPEYSHSEHILDVWDRQTLDDKLARTPVAQAEVFAVLLRVTDKFAAHLMPKAAVDGIYLEPRTMDGRRPDPTFHVIWMPRKTLAEVRLAKSRTEQRTTIVRMGARLGLRVDREHAEQDILVFTIASAVASILCTPLDVARTQLILRREGVQHFASTLQKIKDQDGIAGLMAGWLPRLLWNGLIVGSILGLCRLQYEDAREFFMLG
eukprot:g3925.t1